MWLVAPHSRPIFTHAAQLCRSPPRDEMKGKTLTSTLVQIPPQNGICITPPQNGAKCIL